MTVRWRRLARGETDHELLWGLVGLCGIALAALMLRTAGLPPVFCPFRVFTGLPCLTCGVTRAAAALLDGHLLASLQLNPLVPAAAVAALPGLPYSLATGLLSLPRLRISLSEREARLARVLVVSGAAALWVYLYAAGR